MSSLETSLKTNKIPSGAYLTNDGEPEPKVEKPIDKPVQGAGATWKPGGYTPSRASWHSTKGRIKRLFA